MKRVRNIITICLLSIIGITTFSSCEKIADDTPKAIKKLIRENKKYGGQVIEYEYNSENIYCWWQPCVFDSDALFYDEKGVELWRSGEMGITGNYLEGFYEKAIFKKKIWTDKPTEKCLGDSNLRPVQTPEG